MHNNFTEGIPKLPKQHSVRRLFFSNFLKYLALLLAFLVVLMPIFGVSYTLAKNSTLSVSEHQLTEGLLLFEQQIRQTQAVSGMLLREKDFTQLLALRGGGLPKHVMLMVQMQRKLNSWSQGQPYLLESVVVFEHSPLVFSTNFLAQDYHTVYPSLFSEEDRTAEQWRDLSIFKEKNSPMVFRPVVRINNHYLSKQEIPALPYLINASHYNALNTDAMVISYYDYQQLLSSLISEDVLNDGFFLLLDGEQQAVIHHNCEESDFSVFTENDTVELNGEKFQLLKTYNQFLGYTAVVGIPHSIFNENIRALINTLFLYIVIGIVLAVGMAVFFTLREARAMNKVLQIAAAALNRPLEHGDQYKALEKSFSVLDWEKQENIRKIQTLHQEIKSRMLESILTLGIYSDKEEQEAVEYIGNDFSVFCVAKLAFPQGNPYYKLELQELLTARLPYHFEVASLRPEEMTVVLFLQEGDEANLGPMKKEFLGIVEEFSALEDSPPLYIGISSLHSGVRTARGAYQQAQQAYNTAQNSPVETVSVYQSARVDAVKKIFDVGILVRLNDSIVLGEKALTTQLFQDIMEFFKSQSLRSQEQAPIVFSVRQAVRNAYLQIWQEEEGRPEFPALSYHPQALMEQMEQLLVFSLSLCDVVKKQQVSSNQQLKDDLLLYVQTHTGDKNLNASVIADALQVSEKYVYTLVREQTGKTLGQYVEDLRLDQAEELLLTTNRSNREIFESVGFGSENTFYRAFSKRHNTTPGRWREARNES